MFLWFTYLTFCCACSFLACRCSALEDWKTQYSGLISLHQGSVWKHKYFQYGQARLKAFLISSVLDPDSWWIECSFRYSVYTLVSNSAPIGVRWGGTGITWSFWHYYYLWKLASLFFAPFENSSLEDPSQMCKKTLLSKGAQYLC